MEKELLIQEADMHLKKAQERQQALNFSMIPPLRCHLCPTDNLKIKDTLNIGEMFFTQKTFFLKNYFHF